MSTLFGILFWLVMVDYAVAVALQIHGQVFKREKTIALGTKLVAVGLVFHTVLFAWRWIETGHVPTIGNFENALVGGWFIVIMTLWAG